MAGEKSSAGCLGIESADGSDLEQYRPRLHRYLMRLGVRSSEDVRDLTQQVFANLVEKRKAGQLIQKPQAYLYRAAERAAIDLSRRNSYRLGRLKQLFHSASPLIDNEHSRDPLDVLGALDDLEHEMGKLPEVRREVLALYSQEGCWETVAARLRLSVHTVKKHYTAALAAAFRIKARKDP